MALIKANDILTIRFITDSELRPTCKVISRSKSFAIVDISGEGQVRRKVYSRDGQEYIYPYGQYSMAPVASK